MKHCANDDCPDLVEHDVRGEYRDDVSVCPRCSTALADGPAPDDESPPIWLDLVPVASYTHVPSAHVARAALEAAEIPAFVANENLASMQWFYTTAVGGVQVLVPREHVESARELLEVDHSQSVTAAEPDRCPACGAVAGPPSKLGFRSRALSLLVGFPFVVWRRSVTCDRCGHQWRRSGSAAA